MYHKYGGELLSESLSFGFIDTCPFYQVKVDILRLMYRL